jgi:hypothetical protein
MARTVEVVLDGQAYAMPASYRAAREIAQKVGDPLKLALAAHRSGGAVPMGIDDVVGILAIGVRLAGCKLSTEEIGEAVVDAGVTNYIGTVGDYILAIVSGPEESAPKA